MQRIEWHVVGLGAGLQRFERLVGQRIDLKQTPVGVPFGKRRIGPASRLAAPEAGHPDLGIRQRPAQRLQLAGMAAGVPRLDTVVESVHAVERHEAVDLILPRPEHLD